MKRLLLLLIIFASPVFANGDPDPEPPVVVDPPSPPPKPPQDGDNEYSPYVRQYYALCTCEDFRVAWGFETKEFREYAARNQCLILREKKNCKPHK